MTDTNPAKPTASTRPPRNCHHRRQPILQDDTDRRRFLGLLAEPGAKTDSNYREAVGPWANSVKGAPGMKRKSRWRDDDEMKQRCHGVGWQRGLRSDQAMTPPIAYGRHDGAKVRSARDRPRHCWCYGP